MNVKRKHRLTMILFIISALMLAVGAILYALRQNINLFYTPEALLTTPNAMGKTVRLGGMVVKGSVRHSPKDLSVRFILTDYKRELTVNYRGVLPALFREGQGIVTQGSLTQAGTFNATQVLAKHDANYMPKSMRQALAHQHKVPIS